MSSGHIYFVNRFYWPDQPATAQLLTDLAEALARGGLPITVLTSRSGGQPAEESRNGVSIVRLAGSRQPGRTGLMAKAFAFLRFLLAARRCLGRCLRPGDSVVLLTDPPLLGVALSGLLRNRGARQIHWVQDIFPEVLTAVSGKRIPAALVNGRNRAWQRAGACVAPGEEMASFIGVQNVSPAQIRVSANWAPLGLQPEDPSGWLEQQGLQGRFVLMYAGNLGRVHDFEAIVPLMRELGPDSGVSLVFVGSGARRAALQASIARAGIAHVHFLPAASRAALGATLSAASLHLITLRDGCEALVFPSKLYGIAAVGRPALVLGPAGCEVGRLVVEHGFGAAFEPADLMQIAAFIRELRDSPALASQLSAQSLEFARANGGLDRAAADWRDLLAPDAALASPPSRPDAETTR